MLRFERQEAMAVHMFKADSVDVTIETGAFRERVYYDQRLVSEASALVPRLVTRHRFTAEEPAAAFELRTYEPGGWILLREGTVISSQAPRWVYVVLFSFFAVSQWIDYASDRDAIDAAVAGFSTAALGAVVLIRGLWARTIRLAKAS